MKLHSLARLRVVATLFRYRRSFLGGLLLCCAPIIVSGQSVSFAGSQPSVNFGSANVCPAGQTSPAPCSQTMTLTYNVTTGGTLGTPQALTLGAPNLDFKLTAGTTCSGPVTGGSSCVVKLTFAPVAAGQRKGAVEIVDDAGSVLASTYIYGMGVGPVVAFTPSPQITLGGGFTGFISVSGIALDGYGNVFVADIDAHAIYEILASGGYQAVKQIDSSIARPNGAALDGSGNLFVIDFDESVVKEFLAADSYTTVKTLPSEGLSYPQGLATDGSGNIFVSDTENEAVKEILASSGYTTVNTLASGFEAFGIAVDGSGNVYAVDRDDSLVWEIEAVNGSIPPNPALRTVGSGFYFPNSVAVDAAGDVYVVDSNDVTGGDTVKEILAVNGSVPANPTILTVVANGGDEVAVDPIGQLFIDASYGDSDQILEIPRSQPPGFSFATTNVGATSSDSPQSVTVQNVGNASLAAKGAGVAISPNWVQTEGSGTPPDCAAKFSLLPGGDCNLSISFKPLVTGPLTGTATLTDNTLNAAAPNYATQTIYLASADAPPVALASATSLQFGSIPLGNTATQQLTVTNIGGQHFYNFSTPSPDPNFIISGPYCYSGEVTTGNSCFFTVEFAPQTAGSHDGVLSFNYGPAVLNVPLQGVATGLSTPTTALNFGTIPFGSTAIRTITFTNTLTTGAITLGATTTAPSYKILTTAQNTCQAPIPPGGRCVLPIELSPAVIGPHNDYLNLTPGSNPTRSYFPLNGYATGVGTELATPLNFGTIPPYGNSKVLPLAITNYGVPGKVTLGTSINGVAFKVLTTAANTCLAGISNGQSCVLPIEFAPTSVGNHSELLTLTPTGGAAPSVVHLDGVEGQP